jgi:hypothetical protein
MSASKHHDRPKWDILHLRGHLQGALDLELWTIPYYMTVLYSIKDPACRPYQLVQAAVYQEMLHAQLVSNLANAFGHEPKYKVPVYEGEVPHVDFALDDPDPRQIFKPYSTDLGPLDEERLNTMCLVEYPEWFTEREPDMRENQREYGSIGEFYMALRVGIFELRHHIKGGVKQVDEFGSFYNNFKVPTITLDGDGGYHQAMTLLDAIVDQGEGQTEGDADVPVEFQATSDGVENAWTHYRKFMSIRAMQKLPETWPVTATPTDAGRCAQETLVKDFAGFLATLEALFRGENPPAFGAQMAKLGGDILTCWQRGAVPRFS